MFGTLKGASRPGSFPRWTKHCIKSKIFLKRLNIIWPAFEPELSCAATFCGKNIKSRHDTYGGFLYCKFQKTLHGVKSLIRDIGVGIKILDIIVVVQGFHESDHLLCFFA